MTLPNFIIIGAYKSGTSSLYHYLRQHPEIYMSRIKEPNYFSHEKKAELMEEEGKKVSVIDSMEAYLKLFSAAGKEKAIGEASPIYLGSPIAAERIRQAIPEVKLIVILRHPAEAFYSDHNMRIRDRRQLNDDLYGRFRSLKSRVKAGEMAGPMYYMQLKRYYDLFDPSRIKVYLFEDLKQDSMALVKDILKFLGVDTSYSPEIKRYNAGGIPRIHKLDKFAERLLAKRKVSQSPFWRNSLLKIQALNSVRLPPLSQELKAEFMEIYRDDVQSLEKLIGRDLSGWLS